MERNTGQSILIQISQFDYRQLNCHDLFFFCTAGSVHFITVFICELLNVLLAVLEIVLCDFAVLLHSLELFHSVTADITDSYFTFLGDLLYLLAKLFSSLLCKLRECDTDSLTVVCRSNSDVACKYSLFDRLQFEASQGVITSTLASETATAAIAFICVGTP